MFLKCTACRHPTHPLGLPAHEYNRQAKATRTPDPHRQSARRRPPGSALRLVDLSLVRQAAGELARECHAAVCEATFEKARGMSRNEARGYIGAYAPEFLLKEVDLVLQRRRVRRVVAAADPGRGHRTTRGTGRQGCLPDQIATVDRPGCVKRPDASRSLLPGGTMCVEEKPDCLDLGRNSPFRQKGPTGLRVRKCPLPPGAFPVILDANPPGAASSAKKRSACHRPLAPFGRKGGNQKLLTLGL